jgi:A118 family predicted phage portal protein
MDVTQVIKKICGETKVLPIKSKYQTLWMSWYRSFVEGFHSYLQYNGVGEYIPMRRKSLHMAKHVCESWANLLANEKCGITIPEPQNALLQNVLKATNFKGKLPGAIEKSFALSIGALVQSVIGMKRGNNSGLVDVSTAQVKIDFVNETKIIPITIEDRIITECAFVVKNSDSIVVSIHHKAGNGNYLIDNVTLTDKNEISTDPDKTYQFDTKSTLAWFQTVRPNIESNFMTDVSDDEIGISIFANSTDTLEAIDNKYDGFDFEYLAGRKRVFVSSKAWKMIKKTADGVTETVRTFDFYDPLFFSAPEDETGKPIIATQDTSLRYDAFVKGINTELSYLSSQCGLGENYYKFDGSSVATATQVISENSTLYRNIKKHEALLRDVLFNLTKSIIYATNKFTSNPIGTIKDEDIIIDFDDSIIEDKDSQMKRDRDDVNSGIMSKVEYRMKWYQEDEKTAKEKVQDFFLYDLIDKYSSAITSGLYTPTQFVDKVYPDATNKDELVAYITSFIEKSGQPDMNELYNPSERGDEAVDVELKARVVNFLQGGATVENTAVEFNLSVAQVAQIAQKLTKDSGEEEPEEKPDKEA